MSLRFILEHLEQSRIREISPREAMDWAIVRYGYWLLLKYPRLIPYPKKIFIEPTNICNLRCPLCSNKDMDPKKKGMMSLENFKKIVDNLGPSVKKVQLDQFGESLLNRDFFKMVKYCNEKGIITWVDTNATMLHKFDPEEIFSSGLNSIIFAVDGVTKGVYEQYRVGADFEQVIENIRNFCSEKRRRSLSTPTTCIQFVVTKVNQHQITEIGKLAKEIGADYLSIKSAHYLGEHNAKLRRELIDRWIPDSSRSHYLNATKSSTGHFDICQFPFRTLVINWRGEVVLCCLDFKNEYILGNVLDQPLNEIWKSKGYDEIRREVVNRELEICRRCDLVSIESHAMKTKVSRA